VAQQLGPVPGTNEQSQVKQNVAIQQLFRALKDAPANTALTNTPLLTTGSYAVAPADAGSTIFLSGSGTGAVKSITLGAVSGFPANFQVRISNIDIRGWLIAPTGVTAFILWPGQTCTVFSNGSVWVVDAPDRWKPSLGGIYFINSSIGSDSNDGLITGAGAFATIQHAVDTIHKTLDMTDQGAGIHLDDGVHNVGAGVFLAYAMQAGQIAIQGNATTPAMTIVKGDAGANIFNIQEPATVSISSLGIDGSNGGCTGIAARQFSTLDVADINFINMTGGTCLSVTNHSSSGAIGDMTFTGNFSVGISVTDQSFFNCSAYHFNVTGGGADVFLSVQELSKVNAGVTVIDGGLVAIPYSMDGNSILRSNGTTFPGTGTPFVGPGSIFT
jgi:hypothetical protein